ncbi:MAG: DUF72 domain-containing protein [Deltaproteobacteria bacterium]|nr:DUF72 domain-containing protein [Deltaproteobacteria bacterium]
MARLLVGQPGFTGKLENYAERFDMVELRPVDTPLPGPKKLAAWRRKVPPAFAFSVVLPRAVADLTPGAALDQALEQAVESARVLQASCIVLATPATVRPTARNRDRIATLAERLPRNGHLLAWHAGGMWEAEDVLATASRGGWLPIFDAAQEPLAPGPIVYTRIHAVGNASRLGADRLALVAERLAGRRDAYVVVDAHVAAKVKKGLAAIMAGEGRRRAVPALFRPGQPPPDFGEDEEH